ncbi:MAG: hypothetical protein WC004_01065 [Candidatus Absconditabacterales bacterium]
MSRKNAAATELIERLHDTIGKLKGLLNGDQISKNDLKAIRKTTRPLREVQDHMYSLVEPQIGKKYTIEGIFDGREMATETDVYPVPANYASKSMLIPGDNLKLTIKSNGEMIYKIIKPAPRKHLKGILHKKGTITMALGSDNNNYTLNSAAVTFHKGKPGDEVSIIINAEEQHQYAALENVFRE